jgi:hypothetical protein
VGINPLPVASNLRRANSLPRQRLFSDISSYAPPKGSQSATLGRKFKTVPTEEVKGTPKTKRTIFKNLFRKFGSPSVKHKADHREKKEPERERGQVTQSRSFHGRITQEVKAPPTTVDGYSEVAIPPPKSQTLPRLASNQTTTADGYSEVEIPTKPVRRSQSISQSVRTKVASPPIGRTTEDLYTTVDKARKAKDRAIFQRPETDQHDSVQAEYDHHGYEIVSRSLLKKDSKLRISRTLSADSFNIDDILVMQNLNPPQEEEEEEEERRGG